MTWIVRFTGPRGTLLMMASVTDAELVSRLIEVGAELELEVYLVDLPDSEKVVIKEP